jgi:hypothetical protein
MTLTPKDMLAIIGVMTACIPGVKLSSVDAENMAKGWARLFANFDREQVERAALRVMATHPYNSLPAPAKILDAIRADQQALEPSALEAWGLVYSYLSKYGRYREQEALAALPPRAAYVASRMGWESLCNTEVDNTGVIRAQFIRLYDHSFEHETQLQLPGRRQSAIAPVTQEGVGGC